jgi:hypothetical protein
MSSISEIIKEQCAALLVEVDAHLEKYPMGEYYFWVKAVNSPQFRQTLVTGSIRKLEKLDQLRAFIKDRESHLSGDAQ